MFSLPTEEKDWLGGEIELKGMVWVINDIDGNLLTGEWREHWEDWEEYCEDLMNVENERARGGRTEDS